MRYVRWFLRALLVLVLLPYALLPLYLIVPPPSTLMIGHALMLKSVSRQWVPLARISPHVIAAVVSSEDDAFCEHFGFDFNQMEKSLKKAEKTDRPVKATSTISMQTVKNLFLWGGRSWTRKILEAPLTLWMELILPKRRILEIYLNIAEWGDGVYGIEAAARHHFGVPASALSAHQAALLAVALPDPVRRNAGHPGPGQERLAGELEARLAHGAPDLACLR